MKNERLTATFFLSVIMICLCLVFGSFIDTHHEYALLTAQPEPEEAVNWRQLYQFDDAPVLPSRQPRTLEYIYNYIKNACNKYSSSLFGSMRAVETAKNYEDFIGWNIASAYEYNGVTKLTDGHLTIMHPMIDVSQASSAVADLAAYCKDKGIDFFYAACPKKTCIYEDKDISGTLDFANSNADNLLKLLAQAGLNVYDFRKLLHEDGMNHHASFYKTDNHWKAETGLWAAKHILEFLRDDYGWDVHPQILEPSRFEHVIYPEWFLGSRGRKFMLSRTKPDDFTMLYPKFKTLFQYNVPSKGLNVSGDFSITYNMSSVASKDYYGKNPYAAYGSGNKPLARTHNLMNHNGKRILVIHDSFSLCVVPFVALGTEYTDDIDLRYFTGSLKKYIAVNHPDLVAVCYYLTDVHDTINLDTHKDLYDFR